MKKFTLPVKTSVILALFLSLICIQRTYSQLAAGTYTVGTGYTYTNLAAVATALGSGVSGNVIFELQTNYAEAPSSPITFSSWTGNSTYTVTIRPSAGVASVLSTAGNPGANSPLINLSAAQNMIFDGRPGGSGTSIMWTIQNTSASSAGPAIEMTDGADNNTLQYLNIQSGNELGYSGTVFLYCSSAGPNNTGDIIQNCNIGPNGANYPANAICAYGYGPGSGSVPIYANSHISVLNNTIHDFFSYFPSTIGSGVAVTGTGYNIDYGDNWTITGNSFYRTVNNSISDVQLIIINFAASPTGNGSTGNVISNNYIGGSASALAGGAIIGSWITAANTSNSPSFQGINIEAQSATVSGNVIGGIFDLFVIGQCGFTGIYIPNGNNAGSYAISGNTIGSTYGPGNFYWGTSNTSITTIGMGSKTITTQPGLSYQVGDTVRIATVAYQNGAYSWYMEGNVTAYNTGTGSLTVNVVRYLGSGSNISQWYITLANGIQSSGQWMMEGIWVSVGGGTCSITGNTVGNLTNTNGNSFTTSGIIAQDGSFTITGNTIYNLANSCVPVNPPQLYVGVYGSVVGISQQSLTSAVQKVSNNIIYNLYSIYSGSGSNNITGIELNGITSAAYTHLANANFVYNLSAPNSATGTHIYGIITYSGTHELTNNMIRLGLPDSASTSVTGSLDFEGITDQNSGSASSGTQKIYHNTVYIAGTGVVSGTVNTYCFRRNNSNFSPKDIIDVRNNIFVNNRSNANGTGAHFGIGLDNNSTVTSDYNDVFGSGTGYNFGQVGTTAYATNAAWTSANAAFDVNSKNTDPLLLSPATATPDFHLTAGTPCDAVTGATALYPTDYYGFIRANYTPVDLGAVVYGVAIGPPPEASFLSSDTTFCADNCISFTDLSTNSPTGWQWTFAGGIPSSSTDQNPQSICYLSAGNYAVTLIATNAGGRDTLTINNFIKIKSAPSPPVIRQSNDTLYCSHDSIYISFQWFLDSAIISGATDTFLVVNGSGNYNLQVTNAYGCKTATGIDLILGIGSMNTAGMNNILSLSPNPTTKELIIKIEDSGIENIEIYNILGENVLNPLLKAQNRENEIVVDVSSLSAGIYFVRIENKENSKVAKFIKAANVY